MGTFGDLIREKREGRGLTQGQLAEAVGVSQPAVSDWENGVSYPETVRVPTVAKALRVTPAWLFSAIAADVAATPSQMIDGPDERKRGRGE